MLKIVGKHIFYPQYLDFECIVSKFELQPGLANIPVFSREETFTLLRL